MLTDVHLCGGATGVMVEAGGPGGGRVQAGEEGAAQQRRIGLTSPRRHHLHGRCKVKSGEMVPGHGKSEALLMGTGNSLGLEAKIESSDPKGSGQRHL